MLSLNFTPRGQDTNGGVEARENGIKQLHGHNVSVEPPIARANELEHCVPMKSHLLAVSGY